MTLAGLVGHWNLGALDGTRIRDQSGNGHDGIVIGAITCKGRTGKALRFNGLEDRIEIPDHPDLQITGDISIAAWIYKNGSNGGTRWDAIVAKSANKWDYELLTSKSRSDELAFYSPTCTPDETYGGVAVPSGSWQHVAVTRQDSLVSFFLNGRQLGSAHMPGIFPITGGSLLIGHDGVSGNGMLGMIEEVHLFNRALTPAEIGELQIAKGGDA